MNRLIIIGASGHGKVVADIAEKNGYRDIAFLDDDSSIHKCGKYSVIGNVDQLEKLKGDVFIAIGDPGIRKKILTRYENRAFPVLCHPSAIIADDAEIGKGTAVMAGAVINPGAHVGRGCIINTSSSVDHDCMLEDFVHVAVGAHLCGAVEVGDSTWIGAGATIRNNIRICGGCMIGAGTVVVKDIVYVGVYCGVPARLMKGHDKAL